MGFDRGKQPCPQNIHEYSRNKKEYFLLPCPGFSQGRLRIWTAEMTWMAMYLPHKPEDLAPSTQEKHPVLWHTFVTPMTGGQRQENPAS